MNLTPTPEQQAIIDFARTDRRNLLVSALAGAAKTSTLVMLVRAMPVAPVLCLAFNKKIAVEMKDRMPGHVECSTLNSLGHRSWQAKLGGSNRLNLKADKVNSNIKEWIKAQPKAAQKLGWENFAALGRSVRSAKVSGLLPDDITFEDCDDDLSYDPGEATGLVARFLSQSIDQALQGTIDFDDQIYMPTLFGGQFPNFPTVLVDEAQDLSALNHAMLRKIVRKRLIAVGDPNQSIYGFRGAVANGMQALRQDFAMEQLGLSVTFRCPQALVRRAQRHVPHFRWAEGAAEGEVLDLRSTDEGVWDGPVDDPLWQPAGIPDHAAIICRNNAPLMSVALKLLRAGRGINLVGSDIGPQLLKALKALGPETQNQEASHAAVDKWEADRIKRKRSSEAATRDRGDCLRIFIEAASTLGAAISYAEKIFAAEGPIQLLSIHKSKGLEWSTVYHLDPWRVPSRFTEPGTEAYRQELNCVYVCETRARERLILVNAEDLQS